MPSDLRRLWPVFTFCPPAKSEFLFMCFFAVFFEAVFFY